VRWTSSRFFSVWNVRYSVCALIGAGKHNSRAGHS
jgi:hypothetical protein